MKYVLITLVILLIAIDIFGYYIHDNFTPMFQ